MIGITLTHLNMYIVCSVGSFLSVSVSSLAGHKKPTEREHWEYLGRVTERAERPGQRGWRSMARQLRKRV